MCLVKGEHKVKSLKIFVYVCLTPCLFAVYKFILYKLISSFHFNATFLVLKLCNQISINIIQLLFKVLNCIVFAIISIKFKSIILNDRY